MDSTLAAAKMNRQYRFQRHIYDSTRTHYLLWRRRLIADLQPPPGGSVLEIACGTGWNLLRTARRYPQAQLYGLDISTEMLATAQAGVDRHGLSHRVKLAQGDATAFDPDNLFNRAQFDRVFISYALSMIPSWPLAIDRAASVLAPGGALHIVDFGSLEGLPAVPQTAFRAFLAHYNVTPRPDLEEVTTNIAKHHGLGITFETSPRRYCSYAVLKRAT